jgi:hypothetical protein
MTVRTGIAANKAKLDAMLAQLDGGTIELRVGAQPATPATAASGTLLATLTFGTPAFSAATTSGNNALGTANAITDDSDADATGTAGWFRCKTSGGVAVFDGAVGTDGTFNSADIQIHGRVRCTSLTYTEPM